MSPSIKDETVNNSDIKFSSYVTQNAAQINRQQQQTENYHNQTSSTTAVTSEAAVTAAAVAAAVEAATINGMDVVSSFVEQNIWPTTSTSHQEPASTTQHHHQIVHPLDSTTLMLNAWDPNSFSTSSNLKTDDWDLGALHSATTTAAQQTTSFLDSVSSTAVNPTKDASYTLTATTNHIIPQTPPATSTHFNHGIGTTTTAALASNVTAALLDSLNNFNYSSAPASIANTALSTPNSSGLVTPPMTNYFNTTATPSPSRHQQAAHHKKIASTASAPYHLNNRRCSSVETGKFMQQQQQQQQSTTAIDTGGGASNRRTSSHPSVASVVSLTAHEPVSKIIDGIEYITFLYSHDRLVKEYTVRTDVDYVNMNDITMDFRIQNAVSFVF